MTNLRMFYFTSVIFSFSFIFPVAAHQGKTLPDKKAAPCVLYVLP